MPIDCHLDDDIVVVAPSGEYTTAELRAAFVDALSRATPARARGLLLDLSRSLALANRPTADVRQMGEFVATHRERFGRFAMVAPSDVGYGLMRLGSVVTEDAGVETAVFREIGPAMQWLRGESGG